MSTRFLGVFFVGLSTFVSTYAQEKSNPVFDGLLEKVKKSDPTVDFTKFRMAFTETSRYNPYGDREDKTRDAMNDALEKKDYSKAVTLSLKVMDTNYVDLKAHQVAYQSYTRLKKDEEAKYHKYVLDGLLQSILKSGDGKAPATAYVVISTAEEYVVLAELGVRPTRQALIGDKGEKLDRIEGVQIKSKDPVTIYFNVSKPFKQLEQQLKKGN